MSAKIELYEEGRKVYAPDMFTMTGDNMKHDSVNNIGTIKVPEEQYHKILEYDGKPVISQSSLKKFDENAETWNAKIPFIRTRPVVLGSLLDCATLNPEELGTYAFPTGKEADGRTKEGKAFKANAYKNRKETITPNEVNVIKANIAKLSEDDEVKSMLNGAKTQVQMLDTRGEIGIRGMIDILPSKTSIYGDGICDMKRTGQFLPTQWSKHVFNMRYHWQAAMYLDQYNAICDAHGKPEEKRSRWYFLICNSDAPFGCGINELSERAIELGREQYLAALENFKKSNESGEYPNPWKGEMRLIRTYQETKQLK